MSDPTENFSLDTAPFSVDDTIRRYHDALMSFLRQRSHFQHEAADIAQETYLRLMQYEGAHNVRSASALLFRVATNVGNDRIRSANARHAHDHCSIEELDLLDDHPSPERELDARQELEQVYEVIAELPAKCRQVFILSRVKHMTYPQIAQHCDISVKMVEKHISHALEICLRKVGGGRSRPSNTV